MESCLVSSQPLGLLFDLGVQIGRVDGISGYHGLVENDDSVLGQRTHGKLAMQWMANFPNDDRVQRQVQDVGCLRSNNNPATRQPQYQVAPGPGLLQIMAQALPRIFSRREHHHLSNRPIRWKNQCRQIPQPVTCVPTFSPITTRLRLWGRKKSKTMIGILLSMQREKAVESITL